MEQKQLAQAVFFTYLIHYSNQFWVALLRLGASFRFLPPSHLSRRINQTGTGTADENDTRALNTLFCDRLASSPCRTNADGFREDPSDISRGIGKTRHRSYRHEFG